MGTSPWKRAAISDRAFATVRQRDTSRRHFANVEFRTMQ